MMKIIEFDNGTFDSECRRLSQLIANENFSAIIGIKKGGYHVAAVIWQEFPEKSLFFIETCRPETRIKSKLKINFFLRRSPQKINDILRSIEHKIREFNFSHLIFQEKNRKVILEEDFIDWLKKNPSTTIVLVDDAVDSGRTMLASINEIRFIQHSVKIVTVAITQTFKNPAVVPNYVLHHQCLVRFPWSMDKK